MVTNKFDSLTQRLCCGIVAIVRDQIGKNGSFQQFSTAVISVTDDISGFETITKNRLNQLVRQLWRIYRGKTC